MGNHWSLFCIQTQDWTCVIRIWTGFCRSSVLYSVFWLFNSFLFTSMTPKVSMQSRIGKSNDCANSTMVFTGSRFFYFRNEPEAANTFLLISAIWANQDKVEWNRTPRFLTTLLKSKGKELKMSGGIVLMRLAICFEPLMMMACELVVLILRPWVGLQSCSVSWAIILTTISNWETDNQFVGN